MEGIDVQAFISSQRAKLSRERERLSEDRAPRGILPSGNQAMARATKLRQERVSEYHDYLKGSEKSRVTNYPTKSVAEIRQEMAQERRKELDSRQTAHETDYPPRVQRREGDYGSLKERRLAEERKYRGEMYGNPESSHTSRRRWVGTDSSPSKTEFDNKPFRGNSKHWEEEEQELMKWARNQNRSSSRVQQNRAPTPPTYKSPYTRSPYHQDGDEDHKSMRSISAPVISGGLPGLGGRINDPQTQKEKQKKYAEELRAQIREKEEAKQKDQNREVISKKPQVSLSPERTHLAVSRERGTSRNFDAESNTYNRDREYLQRAPKSPHRDRQDRFAPYPPPHFPDHPGYSYQPWMPPYYHPSMPRGGYQHHDPDYPPPPRDLYYPPHPYSHPMHNPYLPPHGPSHREHWEDLRESRKQRRLRYEDEVEVNHHRSPPGMQKENISPRRNRKDQDVEYTSPLTGGNEKKSIQDKLSYKAELEKQMREKKERDLKAKIEKECYEEKKELEIYDPFGKGGCGAPVRDQHGNVVADLKHIRHINEEKLNATTPSPRHTYSDTTDLSPRTVLNYEKLDEATQKKSEQENYRDYLRKQVQEKEELKQKEKEKKMLEEQKEQERLERERERLREDYERELKRQRQKEEEARMKNEEMKHEAERKRREAARKAEEQQLREVEQERRAAEGRLRALTEKMEQPLPFTNQPRSKSPPIPTLRHKMNQFADPPHTPDRSQQTTYRSSSPPVPALQHKQQTQQVVMSHTHQEQPSVDVHVQVTRSSSPPIPTLRNKQQQQGEASSLSHQESHQHVQETPPDIADNQALEPQTQKTRHNSGTSNRTQSRGSVHSTNQPGNVQTNSSDLQNRQVSSDILTQLAAMRKHLQSQFAKQQPPPSDQVWHPKPKLAAPRIRRHPDEGVLTSALNEFTSLKYQQSGRKEFIEQYPKPPVSGSALDVQQDALLQHQEKKLDRMRQHQVASGRGGEGLLTSDSMQFPLEAHPFQDSNPGYHSDNSHASLNTNEPAAGSHPFPRRRQWGKGGPRIPSAGGQSYFSIDTYEVDSLAARNEERMRRLDAILNAGGSSTHGTRTQTQTGAQGQDPETILQSFLRKTNNAGHSELVSRQSEKSLDCETGFQTIDSLHS